MRGIRSGRAMVGALLVWCLLAGCRVSDDAVAAASQMTATAAGLERYYGGLIAGVTDTIALLEVDAAVTGTPLSAADRAMPEETRAELYKRKQMAESLAALASAMAALTGSKAPAEVQTSATALGNALIGAKALPGGSPIPEGMGKAGRLLLEIVQQHEEKKAAQAMDQTLAAMAELFEKERHTYDSLARFHLREAAAVAKDLTNANGVDVAPMLMPALKPFDLLPVPATPALQQSLRQLSIERLDARVEEGTRREMDASAAMLSALQLMSSRVHTLATGHRMEARNAPFSLQIVNEWMDGLS